MVKGHLAPLVFLLAIGCARATGRYIEDDGGDLFVSHPCDEAAVQSDYWNCGYCGNACNTSDADSCVSGICQCGAGPVCGQGEDCRFGQCIPQDPVGAVCEFDPECSAGHVCIEGRCSFMECVPEECDGFDNDCDGDIDDSDSAGPLLEWCLGDLFQEELGDVLPPCQKGYRVCRGGAWSECLDDIPPLTEQGLLRCDEVDNDCDGCIDGVLGANGVCENADGNNFDIVFVLDISGSMELKIQAMVAATHDFSERFPEIPAFRFGIVLLGYFGDNMQDDDRPMLFLDLSEFDVFAGALANVPQSGGTMEPQYDAVYELGTGELPLTWREGANRIIIVFTDEDGQSYRTNHGLSAVGEQEMCAALTHGEVLAFVTTRELFQDFDQCALLFEVSDDSAAMAANLDTIISDPCRN